MRSKRAAGGCLRPCSQFCAVERRQSIRGGGAVCGVAQFKSTLQPLHADLSEHDLHVVEALGDAEQHLHAAGEGDRLERGEAGEQILPRGLLTRDQVGAEDGEDFTPTAYEWSVAFANGVVVMSWGVIIATIAGPLPKSQTDK